MLKEELLTLFGEICSQRSGDVPKLMKKLEQQLQSLRKQELGTLEEGDLLTLAQLSSKAYFCTLSSAKVARVLHKIIKCLPKICVDELLKELLVTIEILLSSFELSDVKTLSLLIDQNQDARRFVKSFFGKFSQLVKTVVSEDLASLREQDGKEYMHCGAKLCIQALQICQANIQELWNPNLSTSPECLPGSCPDVRVTRRDWEEIELTLVSHLLQSSSSDHVLLVGTALAMLFNCAPSPESVEASYTGIISLLSGEKSKFEFCGVQYPRDGAQPRIQDTFVPTIAIIKGLIVSCDKTTLKSGHHRLMFKIFPHILRLCSGPTTHHYLSFQTLALWWQKLEDSGALNPSAACLKLAASSLNSKSLDHASSPADSPNSNPEKLLTKQPLDTEVGKVGDDALSTNCPDEISDPTYMTSGCPILNSTLDCIWLNWDSPVEGVSGYVLDIFRHLLSIWSKCVQGGTSGYTNLSQVLYERVLSMAWYSKTRYKPLALLMLHVDCEKAIAKYPSLTEELLLCMKINQLAAVASDVYKAFLQQLSFRNRTSGEITLAWKTVWMPVLISGLTSEHMLQRLKVSTYWLGPTLSLVPGSRDLLLLCLAEQLGAGKNFTSDRSDTLRNSLLYAWTVVSRVARENFHVYRDFVQSCCELQSEPLLRSALASADDLVRAEAFHLLASTVRKSEPVSELEIKLLQDFLPYNLKTDSASFRHNLSFSLRKILVRIRDSCLGSVKTKATSETLFKQGLDFVDWLYELLMFSLAPGSAYQRRQTVFDLLFVFFETLMYQEESTSRKGKAHETAEILFKYAQAEGHWNFFRASHFLTILICMEDGAEEIQKQSYKLLSTYFRWPVMINCGTPSRETDLSTQDSLHLASTLSFAQQLMDRALHLVSRPRAFENHSGLLLFSLVLDKYIIGLQMTVTAPQNQAQSFLLGLPEITSGDGGKSTEENNCSLTTPALALLDLLSHRVELSLDAVMTNVAANVKSHPIHGMLQCINQCLQCISRHGRGGTMTSQVWALKLDSVIQLNYKVIDFVLDVLAGGKSLADCPSFADIGSALENLVSSEGGDQDEEMTTLSPQFQLLLSWCWINLKESCSCLAGVTSSSLLLCEKSQHDTAKLRGIGEKLIKMLTTCRHRGAIEGCRSGLYQFSLTLISSQIVDWKHIPKSILQKILGSLSENSMTTSVTRRSAGLPIIVQTILQAACKCGDFDLLESTVAELYSFAIEPVPSSHSQQHDLRQSHALNILKAIFCDASLAPRLMPLLSRMVILVIEGFDSPSWAIRNAATQLLSTLVTRIFGQGNKVSSGSSMSLEEFAALYPDVLSFVCDKLSLYMTAAGNPIRPSLYVMLTLLANIGPLPEHQFSDSRRQLLQKAAECFLSSPLYSLRKLAAQVWVALSPLDQAVCTQQWILQHVQQDRNSLNLLHGWLLCEFYIFDAGMASASTSRVLLSFCVENPWLLLRHAASCALIASLVMQTIQMALGHVMLEGCVELLSPLWLLTEKCLTAACSAEQTVQVAVEQCIRECIKGLRILCQISKEIFYLKFKDVIKKGLRSSSQELRSAMLDCLQERIDQDFLIVDGSLQCLLSDIITSGTDSDVIKSVEILSIFSKRSKAAVSQTQARILEKIFVPLQKYNTWSLRKAAFDLRGILFATLDDKSLLQRMEPLKAWCEEQAGFACPTTNESLRLSAASALRTCGARLVEFCCSHKDVEGVEGSLVSIIKTSLTLLEDTEDEVRQEVSFFISYLCGQTNRHYSVVYSSLSEIISERLYWCVELHRFLLRFLYNKADITHAVTEALHSKSEALFEAETDSAMSEEYVSQLWAFWTLQKMMHKRQPNCSAWLIQMAAEASKELCDLMPVLCKQLNDLMIFNVSNQENVLKVLSGVILLGVLMENTLTDARITEENRRQALTFVDAVNKLQNFQGLHPFLRRKFYETTQPASSLLNPNAL